MEYGDEDFIAWMADLIELWEEDQEEDQGKDQEKDQEKEEEEHDN